MRQFSVGGVAAVERGKMGPLPYLQTYTLFSQQCRATKIFKESDTIKGSRLEKDRPGRLLQQWFRYWMMCT